MKRSKFFSFYFMLFLWLCSGCIPVNDFGEYWDKGKADPALIGKWVSWQGDPRLIEVGASGDSLIFKEMMVAPDGSLTPHLEGEARTFVFADRSFFLFRGKNVMKIDDPSMKDMGNKICQGVLAYEVKDGNIHLFGPDYEAIATAGKAGLVKVGESKFEDQLFGFLALPLMRLDEPTLKLLVAETAQTKQDTTNFNALLEPYQPVSESKDGRVSFYVPYSGSDEEIISAVLESKKKLEEADRLIEKVALEMKSSAPAVEKGWFTFQVVKDKPEVTRSWKHDTERWVETKDIPPVEDIFVLGKDEGSSMGIHYFKRFRTFYFFIERNDQETFVTIAYNWTELAAGCTKYKVVRDKAGHLHLVPFGESWIS